MKREDYPLQKVTLNLYDGHWKMLQILKGRPGASKFVRQVVKEEIDRCMGPQRGPWHIKIDD